jgi:FlaG/FlaF family flagellin (archaellin)
MVAGAVALTGVFAGVAAHFVPGRSSSQPSATGQTPAASTSGGGSSPSPSYGSNGGDNAGSNYSSGSGFQPPSQAPSAVSGSGSVSSGAT